MINDKQIWENTGYALKVERHGNEFRAIIFKKMNDHLDFLEIIIDHNNRIEKLIKKMGLELTTKILTTRSS
jgi:hypothetical protein